MAGTYPDDMGPKLDVREVRNYKISSDILETVEVPTFNNGTDAELDASDDIRELMNIGEISPSGLSLKSFLKH